RARTAGMALTPPTAMARSAWTVSELCIAPTTVPASPPRASEGAGSTGSSPPSSLATALAGAPWWWPVSWPSARCGRLASGSNTASIAPVLTTSPGAPASLTTLPDTGEGTSTTALAVSIDTSGSSRRMVSPSLTNHSTMVASGRPSPRSGRWKVLVWLIVWVSRLFGRSSGSGGRDPSAAARAAAAAISTTVYGSGAGSARAGRGSGVFHRAAGRGDDALHAGQVLHFQAEQRDMGIPAGHALDWRDQVVHRLLGQARGDLGAEAGRARGLLHDHAAPGTRDRLGDGGEVQRAQGGHVDHLGADALGGQRLGGFQRLLHLRAPGDQGHVGALAQHEAHVQRQRLAIVYHQFLVLAVDALGLHVDHRIRVADRRQQHAVGALR